MPRIRSLKYEYFINEDLAQTSSEARLLGLGLTTIADREGRLEDRPLRIKASLFPYHDVDVDKAITELEGAGFLKRYTVDNKRYICIVNFRKHQKPHPKEADSCIPSHEKVRPSREKVRSSPEKDSTSKVVNGLGDLFLGVSGNGTSVNGNGDSVGTGASATESRQQDFDIWKLGVGKLMATGTSEQDARSFLGKLRRDHGPDAVSESITKMLAQNPVDPKAYLIAVLQGRNKHGPKTRTDHNLDAVRQVLAEKEAQRNAIN